MDPTEPFVSKLPKGAARFLAEALEHALANGRRTAEDFIRHFPPSVIMAALDAEPTMRAAFLVSLVGLKERTALRTSSSDAGRMLEIALAEGDADARSVVTLWSPDDRIRFLDARRVWAFLMEGEFWKVPRSKDGGVYRVAQAHLAFMLDRALAHHLVSYENVIEGITIEVIAEKLPRNDMARVFKGAVAAGRSGKPFNDADLYNAMTAATLVDYVPLPHLMGSVLVPMALAAGFVEAVPTLGETPKPPAQPVSLGETPKPPAQPVSLGETPKPPAQPVSLGERPRAVHVGKSANGEAAETSVEAWPDSLPAS